MKNLLSLLVVVLLCFTGCKKHLVIFTPPIVETVKVVQPIKPFEVYTIKQGEQFCDKNFLKPVQYDALKFWVKFDSSAIYSTILADNQKDINKLYGFSDNHAEHHEFSARIGWRWNDNALQLFAYIYNNSVRSFKELGSVAIGTANYCEIKVNGNEYIFTLNSKNITMPRAATSAKGSGYKLYPYFGGDEMAPHQISIMINEVQ